MQVELYTPDMDGTTEIREYVRFCASELNRIHDVSDVKFTEFVDQVEQAVTQKLHGVPLSMAAWTMFLVGEFLTSQDGGTGTRGLFWQAVADTLITREETRAALGDMADTLMPRPEFVRHDYTSGRVCGCGELHDPLPSTQDMIAAARQEIGAMERLAQLRRTLEDFLRQGGDQIPGMPGLHAAFETREVDASDPSAFIPDLPPGAVAGFGVDPGLVEEVGMNNIMRYVQDCVMRGKVQGYVDPDELRAWLRENPA